MPEREITPWSRESTVYGDAIRRDGSYTNWRPHGSGDWLLIYTETGAGRLSSVHGDCVTQSGEVILYAPGEAQDYSTAGQRWHLLWAHFTPKPDWFPGQGWPLNRAKVRALEIPRGEVREQFCKAMLRMVSLVRRASPAMTELAQNALEEALLWTGIALRQKGAPHLDARVGKACEYLTANVQSPFNLQTVARHSGVSVSRLACLFKEQTGVTPQQFFERKRMDRACQLLRRTSLSVSQVAEEAGYVDPFYFSNRFHRQVGKSPSAYRAEQESS